MKKHPAVCVLWLILLTVSAFAQEFRATLKGRVTDTQGAAVANATSETTAAPLTMPRTSTT